jgi:hypothetical protein
MDLSIDQSASGPTKAANGNNNGICLVQMGSYQKAIAMFSNTLQEWNEAVQLPFPDDLNKTGDSSIHQYDNDTTKDTFKVACICSIVTHKVVTESKSIALFKIHNVNDCAAMSFVLIVNLASTVLCLAEEVHDKSRGAAELYTEKARRLLHLSFQIFEDKLNAIDEHNVLDNVDWLRTAAAIFLQISGVCSNTSLEKKRDIVKLHLHNYGCFFTGNQSASAA